MKPHAWNEVIDTDCPRVEPSANDKPAMLRHRRNMRGSIRAFMGLVLTRDEFEAKRRKALKSPL